MGLIYVERMLMSWVKVGVWIFLTEDEIIVPEKAEDDNSMH